MKVPRPSLGRIVLCKLFSTGPVVAAVIVELSEPGSDRVRLQVFGPGSHPAASFPWLSYGEDKVGGWWWPTRVDGTIEVPE